MSAMPQTRQWEQVLEGLVGKRSATASEAAVLEPQWRLVSRDGSTSSVCADCAAGRCGENPKGCLCSKGTKETTISLEQLSGRSPEVPRGPGSEAVASNAGMPQAKPQLFEQASRQSPAATVLEPIAGKRPPFLARTTGTLDLGADFGPAEPAPASPEASQGIPSPPSGELQRVIDHWPRLSRKTRQAILALVGVDSEADSA